MDTGIQSRPVSFEKGEWLWTRIFIRECVQIAMVAMVMLASMSSDFGQIPVPTDAPLPKSPQATASSYKLPDGFELQVVASEPLVQSPTAVCWDASGNMFVSELHGYNLEGQLEIEELNKAGVLDTQVRRVQADEKYVTAAKSGTYGVIKKLRDEDADGEMDKLDVWAKDLPPAYGLVPYRDGVIVACAPDIVYLGDSDGDGVPETRKVLFTGFRTGALERGINAPQWFEDGWIYFGRGWGGSTVSGPNLSKEVFLPDTDFRILPDGSAIEPVTGGTHTFGFAMTASGDRFVVNTTKPAIYVAPLPWRYLLRNPDLPVSGVEVESGDNRIWAISKPHPWRLKRANDPEYYQLYNSRYGAAESDAEGWFSAACGPMIYRDHALPGLNGQYFVCEPSGNLVHRSEIRSVGSVMEIHRVESDAKSEFAATDDSWSHPTQLSHGPDGAIWIVDYYREIIEDYSAIPRHLQQQYGLYSGHDRGRVYRLIHPDMDHQKQSPLSGMTAQELAQQTASNVLWCRQTAMRLLIERKELASASTLRGVLQSSHSSSDALIVAARTLDGLGCLELMDVLPLVQNAAPDVRVHAWQLMERWLGASPEAQSNQSIRIGELAVAAISRESEARVMIQIALSLGECTDGWATDCLVDIAQRYLDIRWMELALSSSITGRGGVVFEKLIKVPGKADAWLPSLAGMIASSQDKEQLAYALAGAAQASPDVRDRLTKILSQKSESRENEKPMEFTIQAQLGSETPLDVSDETFRQYTESLANVRDTNRGKEVFQLRCASCHQVGEWGHAVGPDLLGELGVSEETLVRHLLLPSEKIRPSFETTNLVLSDESVVVGILKDDGPTSLTIVRQEGVQQVVLRKNVVSMKRSFVSLMPSFANVILPQDMANLLEWLKSQLKEPSIKKDPSIEIELETPDR
jgi:putative membrane-bound dehydrogenase-like protein